MAHSVAASASATALSKRGAPVLIFSCVGGCGGGGSGSGSGDGDGGGFTESETGTGRNDARSPEMIPRTFSSSDFAGREPSAGALGLDADDDSICRGEVPPFAAGNGADDEEVVIGDRFDGVSGGNEGKGVGIGPLQPASFHARGAFKDPFPTLSPIPQKISSRRATLPFDRVRPPGPQKMPSRRAAQPSNRGRPPGAGARASSSRQPIFAPRTPTRKMPLVADEGFISFLKVVNSQGEGGAVGSGMQRSAQSTPADAACVAQKTWVDPFPTPDISVRGTPRSPRPGGGEDDDGEGTRRMLRADFETMVLARAIPNIPPIEELGSPEERGRGRSNSVTTKSHPRLQSMGVEKAPVRNVSSEGNLMFAKRPSVEDIFGALKLGPDGNGLLMERDENAASVRDHNGGGTGEVIPLTEPLEHEGSGPESMPLRRRGQRQIRRGSSARLERNRSATINVVTGNDLANEVKILIGQRAGGRATRGGGPLTPDRLSFRAWKAIKSSTAVANAKTSAGELVLSPVRAAASVYRFNSRRASTMLRNTRQRLKERKERRRQRRLARMKEPPPSWWIVIPADHPYKIAWDVLTIIWAVLGAYRTHVRIRDRVFDQSPLIIITEMWFTVDILLNFVTEHKTRGGVVMRDGKAVWARYLTTWFVIDILSLIPWERIYVRPVVEQIKRRNIFQKTFFRSKAVVRVSRLLRGRHIKLFGRVSKQTGTPLRRLVALLIKYVPKYLVFLRNMKGALLVRALRFVHWLHNMYKKFWVKAKTARQTFIARRTSMRAPRLGMLDSSTTSENDSDSDLDMDDDDDADELDGEYESDYSVPITAFHRAHSEGSPMTGGRRRAFSQNQVEAFQ